MKNKVGILMGIIIILAAIGILAIVGCQTVTSTATGYSTATLTHWGFDFATGARTDEAGKYDGETITWNPDAVTTTVEGTTYPSYSNYVWWRGASGSLASVPHQKHMGQVALSTVLTVPSTWDSGSNIWPLLVGCAYVVKCSPEGYAKFRVTSYEASPSWEAEVEYYFTTGTTFDK